MAGKVQTIRPQANPLDVSTIVSIFPKKLRFRNHSIFPGNFEIPPGSLEKPKTCLIRTSYWTYNNYDANQKIDIPASSIEVANACIRDFCIGLHGYKPDSAQPGIFFVPGEYTNQTIKSHPEWETRRAVAVQRQEEWYRKLIEEADFLWAHTSGNPRAIHGDMKRAAEYFGMKDKPWMANVTNTSKKACPFCGFMRLPTFPKCANCHEIVDLEAYGNLRDYAKLGVDAAIVETAKAAPVNPIIGTVKG